jgi:uncharacterized protein (DUF2267 family)
MTMTEELLIGAVASRAGDDDRDRATRAIAATVEALAAGLPAADAVALADDLPPRFAGDVRAAAGREASGDPFAALSAREGARLGVAVEYAHLVCQVLAEYLGGEPRALLHRHLPAPWRDLFHPRPRDPAPPAPHHAPPAGAGHTLASGRPPQPRRPVSQARGDRVQAGSVAATPAPHADGKLSTGEPHGEPVADAHPRSGPRHLSEADG